MVYSRRNLLQLLGSGLTIGFTGCSTLSSGGEQEYAPVVFENNHDVRHTMSVAVTEEPEDGSTVYFSEARLIVPDDDYEYEEGLAFSDHEPDVMALVVLENETTKRANFLFDYNLNELKIVISEDGQIQVLA